MIDPSPASPSRNARPRAGTRRPRAAALLALGMLAGAGRLAADPWYVHYENAERALEAQDWRQAVAEINQAIERRGDSGARVRSYGMRVVDYFPYLKLGIAYHHLGQNEAALEAFETEARLGVVRASPGASGDLERYRRLAAEAREGAAATALDRAAEVVRESLAEARALEERGLLDEAMNALARGLAVAPDHEEALARMASLRARVLARDERRRQDEAAPRLLREAEALLARGEPQEAASRLREVLAFGPSEEASRLLGRAQEAIVASVEAARREGEIAASLAEARELGDAGRIPEALERLETVLALDPGERQAAELRARLVEAAETARRQGEVEGTLEEADAHLAAGRFEAALSAANRVLALERSHPGALEVVRRAYAEISRRMLVDPRRENIPPAIRFADGRREGDGELAERVRDPEFRLSGLAIDGTPVAIALLDAEGREVASTAASQPVGDYFVTEFSARHHLAAGRTVFKVIATDAAGLQAASEYAVIYRRPWLRSPWLFAASVALPAAGLAGVLARRVRRRRRLLRRRFNPYIAGGPVFSDELFYGREPLVQRILQTVHSNSLLLHGERRIGKTSLLHHLRRRLEALEDPEYRFHPVYVDLQGTPEERFFATLADAVCDALPAGVGEADRRPALARAAYDHHDLVREMHGWLKALAGAGGRQVKLVLLIDEVDELNHYDPRINQKLRSLFMKRFAESLVAVVAGVRIRKEWEKEASPWYNFFEEIEVEAISPEAARELVVRPLRGVFRVEPGVAERISELSLGKPFLIQRRCLALVNRLHQEGRRTLTLADVDALERREAP